jgi:hypothetical protein
VSLVEMGAPLGDGDRAPRPLSQKKPSFVARDGRTGEARDLLVDQVGLPRGSFRDHPEAAPEYQRGPRRHRRPAAHDLRGPFRVEGVMPRVLRARLIPARQGAGPHSVSGSTRACGPAASRSDRRDRTTR